MISIKDESVNEKVYDGFYAPVCVSVNENENVECVYVYATTYMQCFCLFAFCCICYELVPSGLLDNKRKIDNLVFENSIGYDFKSVITK